MKPNPKQTRELNKLKRMDPAFEYSWNEKTGVPLRLKGKLSEPQTIEPEMAALNFLKGIKDLYDFASLPDELRLTGVSYDKAGNKHLKFQQMIKNYPVFGHELRIHFDANNAITGVNGKFLPKIQIPDKEVITSAQAIEIALKHDQKNKPDRLKRPAVPVVFLVDEKAAHLAWQITLEGEDKALDGSPTTATWCYYVDSQNGKVLKRFNYEYTHTYTVGSGTGKYSGTNSINTMHDHGAGNYKLENGATGTSAKIVTHDANGGYPPSPVSEDSNNNWNAADQGEESDCHLYTRMVFDYYLINHGRDSYDDAGAEMHIYAHVGNNWNNASWNGSYVKIGDGNGTDNDSLCTIDIVAHEWTHAVTQHTANLVYSDQSGALNESMSDVFAALIDGDWLQGEDCWLKATAPAGRNLQDPTNGGQYDPADPINSVLDGHQPDHMNDIYTGAMDNGGVHINSGIMNKAAYLIATGGIHRGIRVCEGLGRQVLGELYYHALTNHLISSSDFTDMKDAVLDSLHDLYSGDARYNRWRVSITNAFAAVGIGTAEICPLTCWVAPGICPPAPHICTVAPRICPPAPDICRIAPRICPPAPDICRLAPHLCPTAPVAVCKIAPRISCLPGPDPIFDPGIKVLPPDLEIDKIPGITRVHVDALRNLKIKTVSELISSTGSPNKLKKLSQVSEIPTPDLEVLRVEALKLMNP